MINLHLGYFTWNFEVKEAKAHERIEIWCGNPKISNESRHFKYLQLMLLLLVYVVVDRGLVKFARKYGGTT